MCCKPPKRRGGSFSIFIWFLHVFLGPPCTLCPVTVRSPKKMEWIIAKSNTILVRIIFSLHGNGYCAIMFRSLQRCSIGFRSGLEAVPLEEIYKVVLMAHVFVSSDQRILCLIVCDSFTKQHRRFFFFRSRYHKVNSVLKSEQIEGQVTVLSVFDSWRSTVVH